MIYTWSVHKNKGHWVIKDSPFSWACLLKVVQKTSVSLVAVRAACEWSPSSEAVLPSAFLVFSEGYKCTVYWSCWLESMISQDIMGMDYITLMRISVYLKPKICIDTFILLSLTNFYYMTFGEEGRFCGKWYLTWFYEVGRC